MDRRTLALVLVVAGGVVALALGWAFVAAGAPTPVTAPLYMVGALALNPITLIILLVLAFRRPQQQQQQVVVHLDGRTVKVRCNRCGHGNAVGVRFCGGCGAPAAKTGA